MEIYVDGDACPVKQEVMKVAERHKLKVYLVANEWLRLGMHPLAESVVVSEGADAADDWIVDHLQSNDIVITNDIPLADRCLKKGGHVLGAKGKPFDTDNIGMAMAMRELKSDLREMGTIKEGGPAFSKQDRSNFLNALEAMIQRNKKKSG
ncbi:YaiI/YqxD family protein [Curvivirga aplysinae]|uniref:YaiI/YqxD family protein n=1 Tax=Curvivirga aplysinae TaxID=2529852 RepID=UPI0012BB941A|nr:YaiI/YqxD family protein [Curvivirga aplysinae]MTI08886.1 YaiI/YqxD family protein [Curvivirga aplysinae]